MNDRELNEVLKRARIPEREANYWDRFPAQVLRKLHRRQGQGHPEVDWLAAAEGWVGRWRVRALGLATACVLLAVATWLWRPWAGPDKLNLADPGRLTLMKKYLHEIDSLFPNQVQAIVFDSTGPHLRLADKADVSSLQPVYVKICGPKGCFECVTFSGQQIHVNGELCDVLLDRQGGVLVVGPKLVWSSSDPAQHYDGYRINAQALGERS